MEKKEQKGMKKRRRRRGLHAISVDGELEMIMKASSCQRRRRCQAVVVGEIESRKRASTRNWKRNNMLGRRRHRREAVFGGESAVDRKRHSPPSSDGC